MFSHRDRGLRRDMNAHVHASIMKLNDASFGKLFDLMVTTP